MSKIIMIGCILSLFTTSIYAQMRSSEKSDIPLISWDSKNSSDPITIQNGTGIRIFVQINVDKGDRTQGAGINVKNCGATTHIDAGSSGICFSTDPRAPITFTSDSGTLPASGTYVIKTY